MVKFNQPGRGCVARQVVKVISAAERAKNVREAQLREEANKRGHAAAAERLRQRMIVMGLIAAA